jgi:hypothetical protein
MTLDEQLQALKDAERDVEVPPHLEARVMARFDDGQRERVRDQRSQKYSATAIASSARSQPLWLVTAPDARGESRKS